MSLMFISPFTIVRSTPRNAMLRGWASLAGRQTDSFSFHDTKMQVSFQTYESKVAGELASNPPDSDDFAVVRPVQEKFPGFTS